MDQVEETDVIKGCKLGGRYHGSRWLRPLSSESQNEPPAARFSETAETCSSGSFLCVRLLMEHKDLDLFRVSDVHSQQVRL